MPQLAADTILESLGQDNMTAVYYGVMQYSLSEIGEDFDH